jgi:hypothetical protein
MKLRTSMKDGYYADSILMEIFRLHGLRMRDNHIAMMKSQSNNNNDIHVFRGRRI